MIPWKIVYLINGSRREEIIVANTFLTARKLFEAKYGNAVKIISVTRAN